MEKSILDMVSEEKYLKPHYNIKGFTGIEVNGVRFSNLGEMLCYMNKQREQLIKAKDIIKEMLSILSKENIESIYKITNEADEFLKEIE